MAGMAGFFIEFNGTHSGLRAFLRFTRWQTLNFLLRTISPAGPAPNMQSEWLLRKKCYLYNTYLIKD
jgi:hypothetical protein